jgi:hypothetical protein
MLVPVLRLHSLLLVLVLLLYRFRLEPVFLRSGLFPLRSCFEAVLFRNDQRLFWFFAREWLSHGLVSSAVVFLRSGIPPGLVMYVTSYRLYRFFVRSWFFSCVLVPLPIGTLRLG